MQYYELTQNNESGFHEFLIKEAFTDALLFCEKKLIKCHKVLLAASSQYFNELFSMLGDIRNPTVVLKDISLAQLMKILEYIYTGKIRLCAAELNDFKQTAEYFDINIQYFERTPERDQDDLLEFMSQETTLGNLTQDSFRLNDSDNGFSNSILTRVPNEPDRKKIKLTESFQSFSVKSRHQSDSYCSSTECQGNETRKRNYFEFSDDQKKEVALGLLREKCISAGKAQLKPKGL